MVSVLVAVLGTGMAARAAEVQLITAPFLRTGHYAALRVIGAGPGEHRLGGEQIIPVQWSGADDVVLPVLIIGPLVNQLRLDLDGQSITLSVVGLDPDERLVVDVSGTMSAMQITALGERLYPGAARVHGLNLSSGELPVALEAVDAVILPEAPPDAARKGLIAAGVSPLVPGDVTVDAVAAVHHPVPQPIEPDVYTAVHSWRPGRPAAEKRVISLLLLAFTLCVGIVLWVFRSARDQSLALAGLALLLVSSAILWRTVRPDVAILQARFVLGETAGEIVSDQWLFLAAPGATLPVPARVAFVGNTRLIGYDRDHLRRLQPVLVCAPDGTPRELQLTISPGFTACVHQRTAGAADAESTTQAWAAPLADWYRSARRQEAK